MRRDEWAVVDGVLRDFPKINRDKVFWEKYLSAIAGSCGNLDLSRSGGSGISSADRFLDLKESRHFKQLGRIVERVYTGFRSLSALEKRIIGLCCFQCEEMESVAYEVHVSRRHAQRIKIVAYKKMLPFCMEIWHDVLAWRCVEEVEIANCLTPLLERVRGNALSV